MARWFSIAAGLALAAFVTAKGIPTLRHDWNLPIDRLAIGSFLNDSVSGWLSAGFGIANPHPTTYLIGPPLAAVMWVAGPLAALVLFAFFTGYCCARAATALAQRWNGGPVLRAALTLFLTFNPWVYNEIVAGHLVMVLAYGAFAGLLAEMTRGRAASPVRTSLWLVLVQTQLQFFIVAMVVTAIFAAVTKKWLPLVAGAVVVLPSAVGVFAERGALVRIPYGVQWQENQSIAPAALLSLGGYFAGYAERLGVVAAIAVLAMLALAVAGTALGWRRRAARWMALGAIAVFAVATGVHGPIAVPYEWAVRHIPESGVFRELYDLAGLFAVAIAALAASCASRSRALGFVALAAGIILPITWIVRPPDDLWVSSGAYPHPRVASAPFSRVAMLPAFQPLQLRAGGGDGADPDSFVYPGHVAPLNEYYPTYPVRHGAGALRTVRRRSRAAGAGRGRDRRPAVADVAIAGCDRSGCVVTGGPPAHWSRTPGPIDGSVPLVAGCGTTQIVAEVEDLGTCDVFFGDAPGARDVEPVAARSDSIDPATSWIDARLAFGRAPWLAQGLGGAVTQSTAAHSVEPSTWLLAYVQGRLRDDRGQTLARGTGAYRWIAIAPDTNAIVCSGLCVLAAVSAREPPKAGPQGAAAAALGFDELTPWLYRVHATVPPASLVRFNQRYDPGWLAIGAGRLLTHVRVALYANGWLATQRPLGNVILVQITALLQLIAELAGAACVALLLKALVREPTKRA